MNAATPPSDRAPDRAPDRARINERLMLAQVAVQMFGRGEERKVQIGRYIVLDVLGRGGMGTVYRAYDPTLGRRIALKLLRADVMNGQGARARLRREAVALASLSHPNVVAIHEVGDHNGEVFLAMHYVPGIDVARWIAANPVGDRQRRTQALGIVREAGKGLAAAHAAGLVHRDIKPANLLLDAQGVAHVADFGLVRQVGGGFSEPTPMDGEGSDARSSTLTATGAWLGTSRYAAPEQREGSAVDSRSDQFSFCVTAWEILFGAPPWPGDPQPATPPALPRGKDAWLGAALRRGLAAHPEDRYPSIVDLLGALGEGPQRRRRRRSLWASAGILMCVGLGAYVHHRDIRCEPGVAPWQSDPSDDQRRASLQPYVDRWRTTWRQVCEAEIPAEQRLAAQGCLEVAAAGLRGVASLPKPNAAAVMRLREPDVCSSAPPSWALPTEPRARDAIFAVARAATLANVWRDLGDEVQAQAQLAAAAPVAGDRVHPAVASMVHAFAVDTAVLAGDAAAAQAHARRGYAEALTAGDGRAAAAFAMRWAESAAQTGEATAAALWTRHAELCAAQGNP